jgi:hypothetical protein
VQCNRCEAPRCAHRHSSDWCSDRPRNDQKRLLYAMRKQPWHSSSCENGRPTAVVNSGEVSETGYFATTCSANQTTARYGRIRVPTSRDHFDHLTISVWKPFVEDRCTRAPTVSVPTCFSEPSGVEENSLARPRISTRPLEWCAKADFLHNINPPAPVKPIHLDGTAVQSLPQS